jgi:hypothetical protein
MTKLLMWAVGVPFLVVGMVLVTLSQDGGVAVAHQPPTRTS